MTATHEAGVSRWARAVDPLLALGLFAGYLAALVLTARGLGYARDEGFYFHAASTYGRWFELLLSDPARALQLPMVDRYWRENHEHPALMKSLFWLSRRLLDGRVFEETGTSLRFPGMVLSALAVSTTFALGRRCIGRGAGLVAALSFALMPQIFYHSHLAAFDMPVVAMWLLVVYAYYRSLEAGALRWALACAALYGLALDTKHNAWLIPPALVLHAAWLLVWRSLARRRARRAALAEPVPEARRGLLTRVNERVPLALILTPLIAPPLFYALWPWLWHDTWPRWLEYVEFHRQHVYYNMEFLGRTYFEPPFPRSYAWLMTLATVPAITLLLAGSGALHAGVSLWRSARRPAEGSTLGHEPRAVHAWAPLWVACIAANYFPWLLDDTPIFGGTKHWIGAYPFLALFAGQGFVWLGRALESAVAAGSVWLRRAAPLALGACVLAGPLAMTWSSHPWGLTAYTPLVGGAPGAATLGLNRSFWGYTTGAVVDFLNQRMPPGERLYVHDTAFDSLRMLQKDGRLRDDIRAWSTVSGSRYALYHHEQHMSRVEYMIWVDYGTTTPAHVATFDGVPMVWVYERPGAAERAAARARAAARGPRSSKPAAEPAAPEPSLEPEPSAPPASSGGAQPPM